MMRSNQPCGLDHFVDGINHYIQAHGYTLLEVRHFRSTTIFLRFASASRMISSVSVMLRLSSSAMVLMIARALSDRRQVLCGLGLGLRSAVN